MKEPMLTFGRTWVLLSNKGASKFGGGPLCGDRCKEGRTARSRRLMRRKDKLVFQPGFASI